VGCSCRREERIAVMITKATNLYMGVYCHQGVIAHLGGGRYQRQCDYTIQIVRESFGFVDLPNSSVHNEIKTPGTVVVGSYLFYKFEIPDEGLREVVMSFDISAKVIIILNLLMLLTEQLYTSKSPIDTP
jgi:hypothetical protein